MPETAELSGLKQTIANELRTLRMWREMGDREGEERCSQHIDQMLDRLRRYERQNHEATTHR